jgi:uncharacterized protein YegL
MYPEPISVEEFEWARLEAKGITDLGMTFEELNRKLSRSEFLNSPSLSFAPVIFLMTDGYPTDDYKAGLRKLQVNSWYRYGLKVALGIGKEANDDMLAEFTTSPDTVVHAYSGGQLAQLIKKIAVTSSQIGSKSMTLADDVLRDLNDVDVLDKKQEQLAEQIKNIVDSDEFPKDVPFDTGW